MEKGSTSLPLVVGALPTWLADRRVTVPGRVPGYLHRPVLTKRCAPTQRRLTLLQAPAGFGKTTLLAECCRLAARHGVTVAWLSLDEQDDDTTLETYLSFALQRAGLELLRPLAHDPDALGPLEGRTALTLRALELHRGPCVLALDEAECATNGAGAVLDLLARKGPQNLHLAIACRALPKGLDVTAPMFRGELEIITADDLRFSRAEIARLFAGRLTRPRLETVVRESAGWPIALRTQQHASVESMDRVVLRGVMNGWMESRLWSHLTRDDQDFLLDVGLLDCLDAELLDEALGGTGLIERLRNVPGVTGLLEPVHAAAADAWRLHPLVREYCVSRRRRETPDRYRAVHRRLASALARRGETVVAMRHASEAADAALAGDLLTAAGGVCLALQQGSERLLAAERMLSDATVALFPQLRMVRALAHIVKRRFWDARRELDVAAHHLLDAPASGGHQAELELWLTRGFLAQNTCASLDSVEVRALSETLPRLIAGPQAHPLHRAAAAFGLCQISELRGDFDAAWKHAESARGWNRNRCPYLTMNIDFHQGQIAMAKGEPEEARRRYWQGLTVAKGRLFDDARLTVLGKVLMWELELELGRVVDDELESAIASGLWRQCPHFGSYAAAAGVAVEIACQRRGLEPALILLDEMSQDAQRNDLTTFTRYLTAVRVQVLADAGRVAEAEREWREGDLPRSQEQCLDLRTLSWREMEALGCAGLRLHAARGQLQQGRRLARDLIRVATHGGLCRTQMRALAEAVALEHQTGDAEVAGQHLTRFLGLFDATAYARPMVRVRSAAKAVLATCLATERDAARRCLAEALLAKVTAVEADPLPVLTGRERGVLALVATESDRQIAAALGLTVAGVRYHVQRLFAKLGVNDRSTAVDRARSIGLLPQDVKQNANGDAGWDGDEDQ